MAKATEKTIPRSIVSAEAQYTWLDSGKKPYLNCGRRYIPVSAIKNGSQLQKQVEFGPRKKELRNVV